MIKPSLCVSGGKRKMEGAAKQALGTLDNTQLIPGSCIFCFSHVFGTADAVNALHN